MKLSKETGALIDKYVALKEEISDRIYRESGGKYALCCGHELSVQLSAKMGHQHDLAELEAFVGPIHPRHEYEDGSKSYHFMLGEHALGIMLFDAGTTDSRKTGGDSDDV